MVLALMVAFTSLLFSIASAIYNLQLNRLFCKDLEKLEYELRLLGRRIDNKHNNELFILISKLSEVSLERSNEK